MSVQESYTENFLEHYGTKNMRWHERLYQNPDGTYTELGKARRRVGFIRGDSDDKIKIEGKAYKDMTRKELRAAKKRARHNEAERRKTREFNRDKRVALQEADMDFITKNISKFSNEELMEVVDRYKKMQMVKDLDKAEKSKKVNNVIDKAVYYLDKAAQASDKVSRIYNNIQDSSKKKIDKEKAGKELEKLEHEVDKLHNPDKYKTKIDEYKEKGAEYEYLQKKQTYENLKASNKDYQEEKAEKKAQEKAEKEREAAEREQERQEKAEYQRQKEAAKEQKAWEKAKDKDDYDEIKWEKRWDKMQDKFEKEREKEAKYWEKQREKREKERREDEARREKESESYKEWADSIWRATQATKDKREQAEKEANKKQPASSYALTIYNPDSPFYIGSKKNATRLEGKGSSWLSNIFNKSGKDYDQNDYEKALKKVNKAAEESDNAWASLWSKNKDNYSDWFTIKGDYDRDRKWEKKIQSGNYKQIDKMVDEIAKKYRKERPNMSAAAAKKKAEDFVEDWIYKRDIASLG